MQMILLCVPAVQLHQRCAVLIRRIKYGIVALFVNMSMSCSTDSPQRVYHADIFQETCHIFVSEILLKRWTVQPVTVRTVV